MDEARQSAQEEDVTSGGVLRADVLLARCGDDEGDGDGARGPRDREGEVRSGGEGGREGGEAIVLRLLGQGVARSASRPTRSRATSTPKARRRRLPPEALLASFGCGNPTALAELRAGEVVLDLGSGGGIDVLLSAKRVGPTGKAYGLDMTDEMLDLANEEQGEGGRDERRVPARGPSRAIPLPGFVGRRHHFELRHQPFVRQGSGAPRGFPGACARAGASRSPTW